MTTPLPYGSWPSPIAPEDVAAASPRYDGAVFVGDDVWWCESIPSEGGRMAVHRRQPRGRTETILPSPWNARSSVHEYGGGAWAADADAVYFSEKSDGRVYALHPGSSPVALTPADASLRFGGLRMQHGRLLAVAEEHTGASVPARTIVAIPTDGSAASDRTNIAVLAGGSDFVAQPALSPDGSRLAWIAWDHPAMPWDATRLLVRTIGSDDEPIVVGGGTTAALQPMWRSHDELLYLDDPSGRWNVFTWDGSTSRPLAPADADTGGALWVLGTRWYAPLEDGRVVAVRTNGDDEVMVLDGTRSTPLGVDLTAGVGIEDTRGTDVLLYGASPTRPSGLWRVDVDSGRATLVTGGTSPWGPELLPAPVATTVAGPRGPVHSIAYAPRNPAVDAPTDERPPYVVLVHGGPTSHVAAAASGTIAFFTSRGIGVLDVNYGGSTGYGRSYRERLRGKWGVVDVEDVAAAAAGLAASGVADPGRIAIKGGSAGGWTVLSALVGTDVFAAGISRYGVGDARALAADTHDFEARYLDGLIGPLPEAEDLYIERSPLTRAERFRVPLLILQGADDAVVPPSQAEAIRDALASRGIPHAMVVYEGEGHGFRRPETVIDALRKELAFLGAVFGFTPPGVPPLALD